MKEYNYGLGVSIKPRMEPAGIVRAMGETHVCEEKVFDVFLHGKHRATAETYEQALDMAMVLLGALRHRKRH